MNFFEHSDRAKKNSIFLIIALMVSTICIIFVILYVMSFIYVSFFEREYISASPLAILKLVPDNILFFGALSILTIILLGSVVKVFELSKGGAVVAQSIGGKPLMRQNAKTYQEIMLLNIVDEISIASGIPSPLVYVTNDESINAFAAGHTYENAVVGVTSGAINKLNREELQGVIAHEFSHIFNGDMKLNIRTTGVLNGILLISLFGIYVLKSTKYVKSGKNNGSVVLFIVAVGASLYILGSIGVFFGNMIKASINRQREYLADASAVRFTRNPNSIASALKKIGAYGSVLNSPSASEFSHMYFSNGIKSLFSTHPPLKDRIKRVDPAWDGDYKSFIRTSTLKNKSKNENISSSEQKKRKEKMITSLTTAVILDKLNHIGDLSDIQIEKARHDLSQIPISIKELFYNPLETSFIIFSLLMKTMGISTQNSLIDDISDKYNNSLNLKQIKQTFLIVKNEADKLDKEQYLHVINLSISALRQMSLEQYKLFRDTVNFIINSNNQISWFEWNLKYLIIHPLDISFNLSKIPSEIHSSLASIKFEIEILLSSLTYAEYKDNAKAKEAFEKVNSKIDGINLKYFNKESITNTLLENSLREMERARPALRRKIFEIAMICVLEDDKISTKELQSIHALANVLRLPINL